MRSTHARTGSAMPAVLAAGIFLLLAGVGGVTTVLLMRGGGGPNSAEASGNASASLSNDAIEAIGAAARDYLLDDDLGRARAVLEAGVRQHPETHGLRTLLGSLEMQAGDYAAAYTQFEAALAIGPRDPQTEFTAGTLAARIGRDDRAIEHYSAAQRDDPGNPDYPLYLAQVQMRRGELAPAAASLLRASRLDPDRAVVWGSLAEVELRQNRPGVAIEQARKAQALEPRVVAWRVIEARALKRQGEPQAALEVLLALSETDRRSPEMLQLIAESYGMLGRVSDAATLYADAADASPTSARLWREAAVWAERVGDAEQALRRAKHAAMLGDEAAAKMVERFQG
ncbi:MAG: hypothetical protein EA378_02245 [Phycisphaerales bacterium]|nr:MAG: hypothetical protein EA378_02245 [Phycisphaerales bacterium]